MHTLKSWQNRKGKQQKLWHHLPTNFFPFSTSTSENKSSQLTCLLRPVGKAVYSRVTYWQGLMAQPHTHCASVAEITSTYRLSSLLLSKDCPISCTHTLCKCTWSHINIQTICITVIKGLFQLLYTHTVPYRFSSLLLSKDCPSSC